MKIFAFTIAAASLLICASCHCHKKSNITENNDFERFQVTRLHDSIAFESRHTLAGSIEIDSPIIIIARYPGDSNEIRFVTIKGRQLKAGLATSEATNAYEVVERRDSLSTSSKSAVSSSVKTGDIRLPYLITAAGAVIIVALTVLSLRGKRLRLL